MGLGLLCVWGAALSSHMVLQAGPSPALFGTGVTQTRLNVTLAGEREVTVGGEVDDGGRWVVTLPPLPASNIPYTVHLHCGASGSRGPPPLRDVLFGEVWVCGGQSNAEYQLDRDVFGGEKELQLAPTLPRVRGVTLAPSAHAPGLALDQWMTPTAHGDRFPAQFSAACWVFGRLMHKALGGSTPVGLVSTNVGASPVQAWSSPAALDRCNQTGVGAGGKLWRRHIEPYLDMAVAGWTWWQGESNVHRRQCCTLASAEACASHFECQTRALIDDWRETWRPGAADRPFIMVQLEPYTAYGPPAGSLATASIRAVQARLAEIMHGVGLASAVDLGDATAPIDVHPRTKVTVGLRLALEALRLRGGEVEAPAVAPRVLHAVQRSGGRGVVVTFDRRVDMVPAGGCPVPVKHCAGLRLVDDDGASVAAVGATITKGNRLVVDVGRGTPPVAAVEYLQGNWPLASLFGQPIRGKAATLQHMLDSAGGAHHRFPVAPFVVRVKH